MTIRPREVLSAFVDEETSSFETHLSVKEIVTDESQRSRWERYHLIRDTLRGNVPPTVDKEFCKKIMTAIDKTAEIDLPSERSLRNSYTLLKPIAGVAIAASIAVVTVLSVKILIIDSPTGDPAAVAQLQAGDGQDGSKRELTLGGTVASSNPREDARLNSYLVNHAEYASRRSMIPYARFADYSMQQK